MLGVSQGCLSKIWRRNRDTGRPHQGRREKSPCYGKTVNCFEWSEQTASYQLLVCECRWSADLGGGCQFETFGDGFWPPDIGLGVQLNVLGSLWSTGDSVVIGGGGTKCWTSDNGDTVSSVMSPSSPYTTMTVGSGVRRRQEERLTDACIHPNDGNRGLSVMVWGAIHHGGRCELVLVDGAMNQHRYIQIMRNQMLSWATGMFGLKFMYVQDNAPPHTTRDTVAFFDQQDVEVMDWQARSPNMNPIEHVWDQMSVWIRDLDDPQSTVAERNNAVRQEGCGPWSRPCLVV